LSPDGAALIEEVAHLLDHPVAEVLSDSLVGLLHRVFECATTLIAQGVKLNPPKWRLPPAATAWRVGDGTDLLILVAPAEQRPNAAAQEAASDAADDRPDAGNGRADGSAERRTT